jgi:hypothetical protein
MDYKETKYNKIFEIKDISNAKDLPKKFGRPEDYVELHIYNGENMLLESINNFSEYSFPTDLSEEFTTELNLDAFKVLYDYGYTSGEYNLNLNIHRHKIFNTNDPLFTITEISPSRTEVRTTTPSIPNSMLENNIRGFIDEINSSVFFKDFILNFGDNSLATGINLQLNKRKKQYEVLFKLHEPLSQSETVGSKFSVVEGLSDPVSIKIDMGEAEQQDSTDIWLQGPNFKIDTRLNNSVPSAFKNYNQILSYSLTSSYEHLLSKLEHRDVPSIDYTYIRPVTESFGNAYDKDVPYHFENFCHFSSATERLKNFEYKIKLIELYDADLNNVNSITGPTSASTFVKKQKQEIVDKKQTLIKGFDGYEQFLYFTSGTYAWPKETSTTPYTLYPVTSSEAQSWLGHDNDLTPFYGGQLLSASLFDKQNQNNLEYLLPSHIRDNPANDQAKLFVNMMGQHFDQIWIHIKHITEINNTHHLRGVSRDLVAFTLKSLGLDTFDQFENANLIEYILGEGSSGSAYYDSPTNQTLVTASYTDGTPLDIGSIPKEDITKNIWKRLYHNAPHLLKTKGTERGLRALMSCYGVPATLLNVKEYGGPVKNFNLDTDYKTFKYEKSGLALRGSAGTNFFARFPWAGTNIAGRSQKTAELRIKPERVLLNKQIALSIGNSVAHANGLQLTIEASSSGIDVHEEGDNASFARLNLEQAGTVRASTTYFPLYDDSFWNIHLAGEGSNVYFGAYKANFNKNVYKITSSWDSNTYANNFGLNSGAGGDYIFAGGNYYSGSIQELKCNWGEVLSDATLTKHALEPYMYAGNTISSSLTNVVIRLPLGSNDKRTLENHAPGNTHTTALTASLVNYFERATQTATTTWEEVVETHHHITPDSVGISATSEKVRIDTGTIDDNILSTTISSEVSTLDRQPQDFEDLGIFFSPTTEINEDIVYTLGAFRLDDYIGSPLPSAQTASNYEDLKTIRDIYFNKVELKYNYWDYVKLIQYIDHTLFKLIEQWVPFKANTKTGLLIEPHYLERTKFARELPVVNYGRGDRWTETMISGSYNTFNIEVQGEKIDELYSFASSSAVSTNNLLFTTGSDGKRQEQGTNGTLDVHSAYLSINNQEGSQAPIAPYLSSKPDNYIARKSNVLLGNATKGKTSDIYYRSLDKGKEFEF